MRVRALAVVLAVAVTTAGCASPTTTPPTTTPPPTTAATSTVAPDRDRVPFTASNGLDSLVHIYAADVPEPAGLLIWLHGDGAYEFEHPDSDYVMGGPDGVRALAADAGYIVVSALSPDQDGTVTWWEDGSDNADYLADLITHLTGECAVDTSSVVLAGFSGGAQFTTQYFLPEHSGLLEGGAAIVFGGGGVPETEDAQPWNEDLLATFPMHWATGELDDADHSDEGFDALAEAKAGLAFYTEVGFTTSATWIPGVGHELDGRFGRIVADHLPQR